jgi:hypothetical protein
LLKQEQRVVVVPTKETLLELEAVLVQVEMLTLVLLVTVQVAAEPLPQQELLERLALFTRLEVSNE